MKQYAGSQTARLIRACRKWSAQAALLLLCVPLSGCSMYVMGLELFTFDPRQSGETEDHTYHSTIGSSHESWLQVYSADELIALFVGEFASYRIRNGDTILEVGASDAFLGCSAFLLYDSLTWIAEDIDTFALNRQLQTMAFVASLDADGINPGNRLMPLLGSEEGIPLTAHSIPKILIRNTYHHFDDKPRMLAEVKRLLRRGGQLIIGENTPEKPDTKGDCHHIPFVSLVTEIQREGFEMVHDTTIGKEFSILTFEVSE